MAPKIGVTEDVAQNAERTIVLRAVGDSEKRQALDGGVLPGWVARPCRGGVCQRIGGAFLHSTDVATIEAD
jgi:hypothetical protein